MDEFTLYKSTHAHQKGPLRIIDGPSNKTTFKVLLLFTNF